MLLRQPVEAHATFTSCVAFKCSVAAGIGKETQQIPSHRPLGKHVNDPVMHVLDEENDAKVKCIQSPDKSTKATANDSCTAKIKHNPEFATRIYYNSHST